MKKRLIAILSILMAFLVLLPSKAASAKNPTDEILDYVITIDVNEDASLNMYYHIEWKVLEDDIGALEWVKIGIPNDHYVSCTPASDNIKKINMSGSYANIYFKQSYHKNEVVSFDFLLVQEYMYEMNVLTEGESVFYFIPGWFEEFAVDHVEVRWNSDKVLSHSHADSEEDGRIIWTGSLKAGQKLNEIQVTYSNDAFSFDESKARNNDGWDFGTIVVMIIVVGSLMLGVVVPILLVIVVIAMSFKKGSGLTTPGETKKKITRTLIKYYPTCPGCGAARPENADKCEYCGRSFIESEEILEEKEVEDPKKYSTEGTFKYGSSPNTYVRVHVVPIVTHSTTTRSSGSSSHRSSCACAHSCACACACACAGGGRAGCSTKDFYNTGLKLSQLEKKTKR
jgi:hypothetical protein